MTARNILLLFFLLAITPYIWAQDVRELADSDSIGIEETGKEEFHRMILMKYANLAGEDVSEDMPIHDFVPYLDSDGNLVTREEDRFFTERLSLWYVFVSTFKAEDNIEILLYAIEDFLYDNKQGS